MNNQTDDRTGRYRISSDLFEIWDGGHCYVRCKRQPDGSIAFLRWPHRLSPDDLRRLAAWANP